MRASARTARSAAAAVLLAGILAAPPSLSEAAGGNSRRRDDIVEVVERTSPAVVYVGTKQVVETGFRSRDPFFEEFFGDAFGPRRREVESLGSGVIIDPAGTIVTNEHVIRGASEIHVVLADGRQLDAEVVGSDADNDLAVLRIRAADPLPWARLGTSSDLMIGETVVAIGSPFGLQKTVTAGVVSARGRSFRADGKVFNDFVQTDASINPGNSGGPLLNLDGEVIGINTAIFASAQGIGFAIPADKVRRIVRELTEFGKVRPAWVGLTVQRITPPVAKRLDWNRNYGVLVASVEPSSPAHAAGIRIGDLVAEVGGAPITDDEDFDARMRGYPAGTKIALTLMREGAAVPVTFTAVEFPAALAERLAWERLGIEAASAAQGGLAIRKIRRGSPAERAGLHPGDLLLKLNNQPLGSTQALRDALVAARASRSVLLLVRRGRVIAHLTLPFQKG